MTNLGGLRYFLGPEYDKTRKRMVVNKNKYLINNAKIFSMLN